MSNSAKKPADHFYLTTPIYYVNAAPHIGHAYTSLVADVRARWERLLGKQVNFLTGTDEHGQKIARAAAAQNMTPQEHVDGLLPEFIELSTILNLTNTDFIRTTEERHIRGAQEFWRAAAAAGDIYKKSYSGLYCVACEQYYLAKDLVEEKCPVHRTPVEEISEENYFFKLSRYTEALQKHFDANPKFVFPEHRWKEMRQILEEGLEDISISRAREKLSWGIPVPDDDTQVMYVWFDALTNYVTAIGYGADEDFFAKWWPADAHLMSKEINRFHSLLWPAMLLSAGLALPKQIVVHGWLTVDGQKMSKTTGNVVAPKDLIPKYPRDLFRYFLCREIRLGEDGDFSVPKMLERYRSDLQNDLGNLLQRSLVMASKFCDGKVPPISAATYQEQWARYQTHMENWEYDAALNVIWDYVRGLNQLIDQTKPWALAKAGKQTEVENVLYNLLEGLRCIGTALFPFMPETADKILRALNFPYVEPNLTELQTWGLLSPGRELSAPEIIFPPLE